jgi:cellulose biosynthesis protein BcsQ
VKVLATYSIKGGVGKTTAAVNLAHEAAAQGSRVLLWDLDPQGGATFLVRARPRMKGGAERLVGSTGELARHRRGTEEPGLDVVPADFSLRHLDLHLVDAKRPTRRIRRLLRDLGDVYDVVVIDCPPGITLASEAVFEAVDALVVPTIPSTLARRTLAQLRTFLLEVPDPPLVLSFASMADRRRSLHRAVIEELTSAEPGFLPTIVPNASVIERMGVERAPVRAFAPRSAAAAAYRDLWSEIDRRLRTVAG